MSSGSRKHSAGTGARKCIFFDRDGVVNESPREGHYVERWADFRLLPGFVNALRVATNRGYAAIIVSNQRGVARGIMSQTELDTIHRNLEGVLKERYGLELTDILYCPHGEGECDCRKPRPGMLLEAARRHDLDLGQSWMVGDRAGDVAAGKAAGCCTVYVGTGAEDGGADYRVENMNQLAELLESLVEKGRDRP